MTRQATRKLLRSGVLALVLVISASGTASAHHKPCHQRVPCQVPEVPATLLLPASTVGIAATYFVIDHFRGRRDSSDE